MTGLPSFLPTTSDAALNTDLKSLWSQMTVPEHQGAAHLLLSRYPQGHGSGEARARCLQYEFRRHLGLALPPTEPAELWTPFSWPGGTLGSGLISELARALSDGDSATFHVRRSGDQLTVTVQPHPYAGEPGQLAQPVTVVGVPAALDYQLAQHLPMYTETRRNVYETLKNHALLTSNHLEQLNSLPADDTGSGTLDFVFSNGYLNLGACGVRLLSEYGEINTTATQFPMNVMPGEYTVSIQHAGYAPYTTATRVKRGRTQRLNVTLSAANPSGSTL